MALGTHTFHPVGILPAGPSLEARLEDELLIVDCEGRVRSLEVFDGDWEQ